MKHLLTSLVLGILLAAVARAGERPLSPESKISVLTCDPGTEPYAIFGHSAIRISDPPSGIDIVFNYGTFEFDDPDFYRKFLGGRLTYYLGFSLFQDFLPEYKEGHQDVREQVLNMDLPEKQAFWEKLLDKSKVQNRYYTYQFFYDNCSTRIRDDIEWIYRKRLQTDSAFIPVHNSFRQQIQKYFSYNPWVGFGIDICLGLPADKKPNTRQRLFLPQNLYEWLAHSSINQKGSLVSNTVVYDFNQTTPAFDLTSPVFLFWAIFVIAILITLAEIKYQRRLAFFDGLIFTLTGIVGFALLYLWLFTDHDVVRYNWNLLWACPLNAVVIFIPKLRKKYFGCYSVLLLALLISFLILPRYFDSAILPLLLTMIIRAIRITVGKAPH